MVAVNWEKFARLPGAQDENFEKLCRALIRRHYAPHGDFKELANQAGVEFHLQIKTSCPLGSPGRWFGWQCKWYGIPSGRAIGTTRRDKIVDGLDKSRKTLPGLTDWVLWTRHKLTEGDQTWFYGLQPNYPNMKLQLLTADDVPDLLAGPASILREVYFGELVLTPETLAAQHALTLAPVKRKFQPEVHQVAIVESQLRRYLGAAEAWSELTELSHELRSGAHSVERSSTNLSSLLRDQVAYLVDNARRAAATLLELLECLNKGDFPAAQQLASTSVLINASDRQVLARLRSADSQAALTGANLLADLHSARDLCLELSHSLKVKCVGVLATAGYGKSELSIKLTLPEGECIGGVLFLGNALHAGQNLDDLARRFKISGHPVQTFEQLLEAMEAAGQRAARKIPIVLDGLNESEDPRVWKELLASAQVLLQRYSYVLLIATLRTAFDEECLPTDFDKVELNGFADNSKAREAYFTFYKIDATDADLPIEHLEHPLTLRMFCEVANPSRQRIVGVEALPGSLTSLFSRYFDAVAVRIADASPSGKRIYREDVREAMSVIGEMLWTGNDRNIDFRDLRTKLNDVAGWDVSMVRSLESEGILVRTASRGSRQRVSVVYDLMAGQLIADYLLETDDFAAWIKQPANSVKLDPQEQELRHTLGQDTLQALVDLYPSKTRRQLWQIAPNALYLYALFLSSSSDPMHINRETVNELAAQAGSRVDFSKALFPRLRATRAALAHPLDANFLDTLLRSMTASHRDLCWSEWMLSQQKDVHEDLKSLRERWDSGTVGHRESTRVLWVMWTLTTTDRYARDLATHALMAFALKQPAEYFKLMLNALSVPDPYVPERLCAAGYGAALCSWAGGASSPMTIALPLIAKEILAAMFVPGAPSPTRHTLQRQYCLGIIALAQKVDPTCVTLSEMEYLKPPFTHLPNPFEGASSFSSTQIENADSAAIGMDFGNYTIGPMIPDRHNYDSKNPEYIETRRQIVERMLQLGYDPDAFSKVDSNREGGGRSREKRKIDRYGKKYSWIAYFEMWGWRQDNGRLSEWRGAERTSDADIDPSFPGLHVQWTPVLSDLFGSSSDDMLAWIKDGPIPDYRSLLNSSSLQLADGDWTMIDGYIDETAERDYRNVFTFIRAVMVPQSETRQLKEIFDAMEYPGNNAIPSAPERYYTYAGEMPFGTPPGILDKDHPLESSSSGRVEIRHPNRTFEVTVQIPTQQYSWESYHSELNMGGGASLPSAALCQSLGLRYKQGSWDWVDSNGVASLYRELGDSGSTTLSGNATYIRTDLLLKHLENSNQVLVWMMWGERGRHYRDPQKNGKEIFDVINSDGHIHKRFATFPASP